MFSSDKHLYELLQFYDLDVPTRTIQRLASLLQMSCEYRPTVAKTWHWQRETPKNLQKNPHQTTQIEVQTPPDEDIRGPWTSVPWQRSAQQNRLGRSGSCYTSWYQVFHLLHSSVSFRNKAACNFSLLKLFSSKSGIQVSQKSPSQAHAKQNLLSLWLV